MKQRVDYRYKADKVTFWREIVSKLAEFTRKKEKLLEEKLSKDLPKDEL